MACAICGWVLEPSATFCPNCGASSEAGPVAQKKPENDAVMRMIAPVGRSWVAIAAGYAGLFACVLVPAPIALGLGIWAVYDLRKHPEKHGMGRAVFAIVMGVVGTVLLILAVVNAPQPTTLE